MMLRWSLNWRVLKAAMWLLVAAVLCGAGLLPGAASRQHGWLVSPAAADGSVLVHHLPSGSDWAALRPSVRLSVAPLAIAAHEDALLYVLPRSSAGPAVLSVRSVRVSEVPGTGWEYARARVLPPIPLDSRAEDAERDDDAEPLPSARLAGFGAARGPGPDGRVVVALLEHDSGAAERVLLMLTRDGWRSAAMPDGIRVSSPVWLVATGGVVSVVQRGALLSGSGAGVLRVWSIDAGDLLASRDAWTAWQSEVPAGQFDLIGIDGQVVVISGVQGDGHRRLTLLRPSGALPIGQLAARSGAALGLMGVGEGGGAAVVAVVFPSEGSTSRPEVFAWSLSGALLHEGPTVSVGPVTVGQVGLLALALMSLFFSMLVFIVRPASTWNPEVVLPRGASLATVGRRLLAFVFDVAPGMFASSVVFPAGVGTGWLESLGGLAPLLFVMVVTVTHTAFLEALAGRTVGKMVLGIRTIDAKGSRPSVKQAVLRSVVKVLCPPLMFFTLTNPYMPGPAGFGTVVIVDDGSEEEDTGAGEGPGGGAGGGDGRP